MATTDANNSEENAVDIDEHIEHRRHSRWDDDYPSSIEMALMR